MNSNTKIALSNEELELVNNTGIILTKRAIIEKVYQLFGHLAQTYHGVLNIHKEKLLPVLATQSPKIARGENYLLLPYVVLDYPRVYEKENTLAVRTMFWWGNFISVTLHVSGTYKTIVEQKLVAAIPQLQAADFFACVNDDQWQHHFEAGNYMPLKEKSATAIQQLILQRHFIKLAVKFDLHQWERVKEQAVAAFTTLTAMLAA